MASQMGVVMTSNFPPCVYVCGFSSKCIVCILCIKCMYFMYKRGTWRVWQTGCRTIRSHNTFFTIDTLRRFNISLFFGTDIIIPGLNNVKEKLFPQFYLLYCCHVAWCWPKLSAVTCRICEKWKNVRTLMVLH
jgi:hypothetical protein